MGGDAGGTDTRYRRPALASAEHFVPLGLHATPDGSLVFDPPDPAVVEDVRVLLAACAELRLGEGTRCPVPSLKDQRHKLHLILHTLMTAMGAPDGGEPYQPKTLLATALDRFPQLADFDELAAGSGDPATDPLHEDGTLRDQVEVDWNKGVAL